MKKSTSIILTAVLTASVAAPATAAITHELSAPDASVRWVPAPGLGPVRPGTITEEDKMRPGAHGGARWQEGVESDDRSWWQRPRESRATNGTPYDADGSFTSHLIDERNLPADATYQWWVAGKPVTEPAKLPVKPYSLSEEKARQDLQLVYTYTLGGKEVTYTTATQNSGRR